jgi:hypothetical protein
MPNMDSTDVPKAQCGECGGSEYKQSGEDEQGFPIYVCECGNEVIWE